MLTAINEALYPLAAFTDVMSGEKYIDSSAILPIINLLSTSVFKENEEDKPLNNIVVEPQS